jgi:hypothetical protein
VSDDYYRDSAGRIFPLPSTTPEFQELMRDCLANITQEEAQLREYYRNLTENDKQFLRSLHIQWSVEK